jgi:A/G-specific adenine glycosylase
LVDAVLAWGERALRDLPWRASRDPWAILVAEIMLQQTQAARVIDRWHEFLGRYPTPARCASSSLGDVLRLWQGLGYPRRARHLHAAAQAITSAGVFPDTLEGLLGLPGVGPYTARAVAVFAFEAPAAVVDTNIARVLARLGGQRLSAAAVQRRADALVPPDQPWRWNQSLMELGALVCRPTPQCERCPAGPWCAWYGQGRPEPDPARRSAGVSGPQARFEGSARQARGKLMAALSHGPVPLAKVDTVMDRPSELARRLAEELVAEGLAVVAGAELRLP